MKGNELLFEAMGNIGDDLIASASRSKKKSSAAAAFWSKWGTAAACLLMLVIVNVVFIFLYKWDGNPADTRDPAATLNDYTDASKSKYEIYVYNEEQYRRIDYENEEAMDDAPPYKLLDQFYPDAFIYGDFDTNTMLGYFVNEKMHYNNKIDNYVFDYEKDYAIPKSKIVNSLNFAGETYDVEYRGGKTSGYVDEADATVYDTYAVYDYNGEEYGITFYVRLDGEIVGAVADYEQTSPAFSAEEGEKMAQKYLRDILGDEADDYELYSYYRHGLYHGIHFCNKIDGVLTNDVVYMELTGDGMLYKYTSEGRGRFRQYEDTISKEEVNKYVAYLKEKLDHLGISTSESGTISEEPTILEYGGEQYIYLRLIPFVKVNQDGECIGYLRQITWFFIKIEQ